MSNSAIHAFRTQCSMKDYPGRMSALFFTPGCNFRCGFCHNSGLFEAVKTYSWEELEDICESFRKQWVSAVVITGGEPTVHETLPETIRFFKKRGFAVKLDSNGSNPLMLEKLLPELNYVAMDIKCSLDTYPKLTGYNNPDNIRASIKLIKDKAKDYEFRTTVIETVHSDQELLACAEEIQGAKRYILQPFVPHEDLPEEALREQPRTSQAFLRHAAVLLRNYVQELIIRGE